MEKDVIFSVSEILDIECKSKEAILKEMILKILLSTKVDDG